MSYPLWDQHCCLPLRPDADLALLEQYANPAGAFVSVNVGYSPHSAADAFALIAGYKASLEQRGDLTLGTTANQVDAAWAAGRLAVAFDLEDSAPLEGNLDNVGLFADMGLRSLIPTYNRVNAAGCGSLDTTDTGLTAWGRDLVTELNRAGVVVDGSHCGEQTGLGLCRSSTRPVIYSHSCMRSVWNHPRNITDDQARACADTAGVVGITGVGIFLGPNTPTLDAMVHHLEAAIELVGVDHVGVSTDYSFDGPDFVNELRTHPHLFDDSYTRWGPIEWMTPRTLLTLHAALADRGWTRSDITAVTSGNFRRVAIATWPT